GSGGDPADADPRGQGSRPEQHQHDDDGAGEGTIEAEPVGNAEDFHQAEEGDGVEEGKESAFAIGPESEAKPEPHEQEEGEEQDIAKPRGDIVNAPGVVVFDVEGAEIEPVVDGLVRPVGKRSDHPVVKAADLQNRGSGVHGLEVVGVEAAPSKLEETGMLARIVLPGAEEFEGDKQDQHGHGQQEGEEAEKPFPDGTSGGGDARQGSEKEGHAPLDEGEAFGPEGRANEERAKENEVEDGNQFHSSRQQARPAHAADHAKHQRDLGPGGDPGESLEIVLQLDIAPQDGHDEPRVEDEIPEEQKVGDEEDRHEKAVEARRENGFPEADRRWRWLARQPKAL